MRTNGIKTSLTCECKKEGKDTDFYEKTDINISVDLSGNETCLCIKFLDKCLRVNAQDFIQAIDAHKINTY